MTAAPEHFCKSKPLHCCMHCSNMVVIQKMFAGQHEVKCKKHDFVIVNVGFMAYFNSDQTTCRDFEGKEEK